MDVGSLWDCNGIPSHASQPQLFVSNFIYYTRARQRLAFQLARTRRICLFCRVRVFIVSFVEKCVFLEKRSLWAVSTLSNAGQWSRQSPRWKFNGTWSKSMKETQPQWKNAIWRITAVLKNSSSNDTHTLSQPQHYVGIGKTQTQNIITNGTTFFWSKKRKTAVGRQWRRHSNKSTAVERSKWILQKIKIKK